MTPQQVAIAGVKVPVPARSDTRAITVPADFQLRPVDGEIRAQVGVINQQVSSRIDLPTKTGTLTQSSSDQVELPPTENEIFVPGSLGVLEKFVGKFEGRGFNMIFRPASKFGTDRNRETVLELNVTSETLSFMDSDILGNIPNRGFDDQGNVMLKGVPYTQTVGDLVNEQTPKVERKKPISIHFEQGLFLRTPATENPKVGATIARLASIPHGTTINAQCLEPPTTPLSGKPVIPEVSILPFFVSPDGSKGAEVQTFKNPVLRVPQNINDFRDSTIPLTIEQNPNKVLNDVNAKRTNNIQSHFTFTVSTTGTKQLPGGGASNIAFLVGQKPKGGPTGKGNAVVADMTCTYWVSTILSDVIIPAGDYDKKPVQLSVSPEEGKTGLAVPLFKIELTKKVSTNTTIKLPWTQIQYSQNVSLDFGTLRWPHISVATLIPAKDQPLIVGADSPLLKLV